ncbi:ABC transporter permease [Euzebyella saccharophila]|uniref:ABC transporter permease n=1 Tax=Euzebyella saccharophila TaxID=679664 RepID=A0ABV8JNH8_9FLAO|nr:ABC transporter permease [Euzebyella saccharophila]
MFKLFVKLAVRFLFKNKLYSFINIFGLAVGIASFVLIMVYVGYERSYDKFPGSENVYRVFMDYLEGEGFEPGDAMTYNLTGPTLVQEFPEVEDYVRFLYFEKMTFVVGDKIIDQPMGSLADASYFNIFNYPLMKGDKETALKEPNTIVLSQTLAEKLFGEENPMKKTLMVVWENERVNLTVTGVMEDMPRNAHYRNNYLISFATEKTWGVFHESRLEPNWNQNNYYTYIKVVPNTDWKALQSKIMTSDIEKDEEERHNIEPIESIHLYSAKPYEVEVNGSGTRIKFLMAIAFVILVLSWMNYVNLSTSKSLERAKETGIRKVSGAQRPQLIVQSLAESVLLNVIAMGIGLGLVLLVLPFFEKILDLPLQLNAHEISTWLPIIGILLGGMLLAGLYPAILLSGYSPIKALKGKIQTTSGELNVRKGLILAQFTITIVLLVCTLVVSKQIIFLKDQPIGVELNQILALKGEVVSADNDSILFTKYKVLVSELEKIPMVKSVSMAKTYPGDSFDNLSSSRGMVLPSGNDDDKNITYHYYAQPNYFNLLGIEFVAGSTFIPSAGNDTEQVVVNETFLKTMGLGAPQQIVDKTLKFWGYEWQIKGVIKDYHHFGLKSALLPLVIRYQNDADNVLVKLDEKAVTSNGMSAAITQLKNKWEEVFPKGTFGYTFLDKKFEAQYAQEQTFGQAFKVFAGIAILIAMLGLFGLTSYTVVQRKKEIGIRKVNGATVFEVLKMLNISFVKWVFIAFLVAAPIAWYAMNKWLEGFAYKTELNWWIFAISGGGAMLIGLITVSWQSFRAAIANPVDSIRTE